MVLKSIQIHNQNNTFCKLLNIYSKYFKKCFTTDWINNFQIDDYKISHLKQLLKSVVPSQLISYPFRINPLLHISSFFSLFLTEFRFCSII